MPANKQPWLCEGSPWKTESAFWTWVRGVLRKGWSKHPIKLEYIKRHRSRIPNPKPNKRFPEVWGMICECCKQPTVQTNIEIDHIGEEGTFTGLRDVEGYVAHLFLVDYESLRAVCKPCHKIISYSQRSGMSFADAQIEKEVIDICKRKAKDVVAFCLDYGYNATELTNPEKRRKAVQTILRSV